MRNHACLLDHHQRSHYDTIGQKNWVQKLFNNQKGKLFNSQKEKLLDSHEEKFLDKQNSSNQPNQSQNQSVIDQGNLITNTKCLLIKAKHPGLKRSRRNLLTKNSVLQIDRGNLKICLKTPLFSKLTMEQGNLMSVTAQVHTQ